MAQWIRARRLRRHLTGTQKGTRVWWENRPRKTCHPPLYASMRNGSSSIKHGTLKWGSLCSDAPCDIGPGCQLILTPRAFSLCCWTSQRRCLTSLLLDFIITVPNPWAMRPLLDPETMIEQHCSDMLFPPIYIKSKPWTFSVQKARQPQPMTEATWKWHRLSPMSWTWPPRRFVWINDRRILLPTYQPSEPRDV